MSEFQKAMLGPGSGGRGAGLGEEGVVSAYAPWEGLSQKTVKSPLQKVGKTDPLPFICNGPGGASQK